MLQDPVESNRLKAGIAALLGPLSDGDAVFLKGACKNDTNILGVVRLKPQTLSRNLCGGRLPCGLACHDRIPKSRQVTIVLVMHQQVGALHDVRNLGATRNLRVQVPLL